MRPTGPLGLSGAGTSKVEVWDPELACEALEQDRQLGSGVAIKVDRKPQSSLPAVLLDLACLKRAALVQSEVLVP
jgi:hypothetical protein